jgi:hypothetical protein
VSGLDRIENNLSLLRAWAETGKPLPFIDEGQDFVLGEPMSESEIAKMEHEFGVALPTEYRSFIQRFGDPRVGPSFGIRPAKDGLTKSSSRPFPLDKPFLGFCSPSHQSLPADRLPGDQRELLACCNAISKVDGVLRLCDYGCAMYGVLVLNGPNRGRVWMQVADSAYYGPFGGLEILHDEDMSHSWTPTDSPRDYWFFEWYEHWLNVKLKAAGFIPWQS